MHSLLVLPRRDGAAQRPSCCLAIALGAQVRRWLLHRKGIARKAHSPERRRDNLLRTVSLPGLFGHKLKPHAEPQRRARSTIGLSARAGHTLATPVAFHMRCRPSRDKRGETLHGFFTPCEVTKRGRNAAPASGRVNLLPSSHSAPWEGRWKKTAQSLCRRACT